MVDFYTAVIYRDDKTGEWHYMLLPSSMVAGDLKLQVKNLQSTIDYLSEIIDGLKAYAEG